MTQLSGPSVRQFFTLADLPVLARLSLYAWVVMLLRAPSCLVTSTTDFPVPSPTAPFLHATTALATPLSGGSGTPVTKVIYVDRSKEVSAITFSAYVQSEDLGRELYPRVFVNYNIAPPPYLRYATFGGGPRIPPSDFQDVRSISASLPSNDLMSLKAGCYQASLIVTHRFDDISNIPERESDQSIVVWWMLIEDQPSTIAMSSCPGVPPPASNDAGVDQ